MRDADNLRIALILPVHATPAARAATQIVAFLLRTSRRLELALLSRDMFVQPAPGETERFGLLFGAAEVGLPPGDLAARDRLERTVRLQVERQYARQGVPEVSYDLQIV